jgi:hypothetical protein
MVKFDASPSLEKGKCVSYSTPKGWGKGGDHGTPKSQAAPAQAQKIVTTATDGAKFAHGGSGHMFGKQSVTSAESE